MLKLLLGDPNARKLKRYQPIVSDINLLEEEIAPLSTTTFSSKDILISGTPRQCWLTRESASYPGRNFA